MSVVRCLQAVRALHLPAACRQGRQQVCHYVGECGEREELQQLGDGVYLDMFYNGNV
jgi:hypothetical protein